MDPCFILPWQTKHPCSSLYRGATASCRSILLDRSVHHPVAMDGEDMGTDIDVDQANNKWHNRYTNSKIVFVLSTSLSLSLPLSLSLSLCSPTRPFHTRLCTPLHLCTFARLCTHGHTTNATNTLCLLSSPFLCPDLFKFWLCSQYFVVSIVISVHPRSLLMFSFSLFAFFDQKRKRSAMRETGDQSDQVRIPSFFIALLGSSNGEGSIGSHDHCLLPWTEQRRRGRLEPFA